MKKNFVYTLLIFLLIGLLFISFKIISGKYDKQNTIILFFKEIVPVKLMNYLRNYVYELRKNLNKNKIENLQKAKWDQDLNGELILSKIIKSNTGKKNIMLENSFYLLNSQIYPMVMQLFLTLKEHITQKQLMRKL